jgi:hypothetical protein
MGKNPLKRSLIFGIVFLFLSTTCLPVLAGEGKPDLIVSSMGFSSIHWEDCGVATIKNIGDAKTIDNIYVDYKFTRLLFRTVGRFGTFWASGVLEPEKETTFHLIYEKDLPKFGVFEFKCTVNPGRTIEESNYDNNELSQKYVAFLGQWKEIG